MHPVSLCGQLVTLREFRHDDIDDAFHVVGDDRVTTWLSFDSRSRTATADMITGAIERASHEPRIEYYLAVAAENDVLIGFVRFGFAGVKAAKLGYAIRADRWGKGYATDACRTMIEFGFTALGLHRISAAIGSDRTAGVGGEFLSYPDVSICGVSELRSDMRLPGAGVGSARSPGTSRSCRARSGPRRPGSAGPTRPAPTRN